MSNSSKGNSMNKLICFAISFAGSFGSAFAQNTVTPELYGELPTVDEAAISPDGASLALLQHGGGATGVLFYKLSDLKSPPAGAGLGDAKGRNIVWGDNNHLLLLASRTYELSTNKGLKTTEMWRWLSFDAAKLKPNMLFGNDPGYFNPDPGTLQALVGNAPGKAVFTRWTGSAKPTFKGGSNSRLGGDSAWGYSVFSVDLKSGAETQVARGEQNTEDWVIASDGEPLARIDYDPSKEVREIRMRDGKNFPLTASLPEKKGEGASVSFYGATPAPGHAYATLYGDQGRRSFVDFNLSEGKAEQVFYSNPQYDIDSIIFDYAKAAPFGVAYTDDLPRVMPIDAADQKLQASLVKALPGAAPIIVSKSTDGMRMIVKAIYTDHPDQYFFYDRAAKTMNMIATSYPKLDGKVHARKEKYDYTAADGLKISGYLTVPAGSSKSNMPLIVLPHGGPEGRDDMTFDWWSFFYAARGYLVYQPNFRGSDGYGVEFREAGYGEWGRKMQDDVTNGVKKLIADGIADPKRVCIVGASYGGYAALAGATLTPELYQCAVSVAGVSNLPKLIGEVAQRSELGEDYWETRIGSRFRDTKSLDAVSPAKIAERTGPPVLLIHGKDDTVVPIGQSRQMRDALKAAGKPYEYVELEGEDHWLSTSAARTEMLAQSIAFIDHNIGNR